MRQQSFLGGFLYTATVLAASETSTSPCALLENTLANLSQPIVPAELAFNCLTSVPVDVQGDVQQIEEIKLFLQWQSDMAYIEHPPEHSFLEPVKIYGELDNIIEHLKLGDYANEYEVQRDIAHLLRSARDGHLYYVGDIYTGLVYFLRDQEAILTSVSWNGKDIPSIYTQSDVQHASSHPSFQASEVRSVNGCDATTYLAKTGHQSYLADPSARYQAAFPNQAQLSLGGVGGYGQFYVGEYDGPSTILEFANGTSRNFTNLAKIAVNMSGVDSGKAFFDKFCTGQSHFLNQSTPGGGSTTVPNIGYPSPVVRQKLAGAVAGYFLEGSELHSETAILSIPTFLTGGYVSYLNSGLTSSGLNEFQAVVQEFLKKAVKDGKRRLVIDVRGNPGGDGICADDLYKQLFPSEVPWVGFRTRDSESFGQLVKAVPKYVNGALRTNNFTTYNYDELLFWLADYRHNLDSNGQALDSPSDLYGPQLVHNDMFTPVVRNNYSDPYSYSQAGYSVSGYLNRTHDFLPKQPFAAEDILLITDGFCASTCARLLELLRHQGNVKTVVFGGLPNKDQVRATGGTRGALELSFDVLQAYGRRIFELTPDSEREAFNQGALGQLAGAKQALIRASTDGATGAHAASINAQDALKQGDTTQTPLQYTYDAADGRLFYTAEMILDPTAVWKGVIDAWWGNTGLAQGNVVKERATPTIQARLPAPDTTAQKSHKKRDRCDNFGIGSYCSGSSSTSTISSATASTTCDDFGIGKYCHKTTTTASSVANASTMVVVPALWVTFAAMVALLPFAASMT